MRRPSSLLLSLKGMAMGMAEVVPGVSGGTIAFITGIYKRLINAIKAISSFPIGILKTKGIKGLWQHIDGSFLLWLGGGMVLGVLVGVFGISYLLEHYPTLIWGFFFGLIIGSTIYIGRQVKNWSWKTILALVIGISVAFYITVISPSQGSHHLLFVFLSGSIAICALILPGISGSFILLLMGMYTFILHSVKDLLSNQSFSSFIIVSVFCLGCLVGIMLFSNVLSWTFRKYEDMTLSVLTGFMIGSLNRIWPWRNANLWLDKESGEYISTIPTNGSTEQFHVVQELNVAPNAFAGEPFIIGVAICFILGLALVYLFSKTAVAEEA